MLHSADYSQNTRLIAPYLASLQAGAAWADAGCKNISHFFNPQTRKGIWGFASAACDFVHYLNKADLRNQQGNAEDAIFYLGAAAHLLQDVCVPHHTCGLLFEGHKEYEYWVEQNFTNYFITTDSIESHFKKPFQLFFSNATASMKAISLVNQENELNYHQATQKLLPLAQYSTAGLFHWFTNKLQLTSPPADYSVKLSGAASL